METCLCHTSHSQFLHADLRTSGPHLRHAAPKALRHSHKGLKPKALPVPGQPDLPSCATSDASTLRAGYSRLTCRQQSSSSSPIGFRSSNSSSRGSSRGVSGPDVCVRASTSASAGGDSGDAGLQGSQQSLGGKLQSFVQAFWKFVRPHTIRGTLLGTTALTTRALLENPHLIDWGLLPKALMGLLALLCGNGFIVGINQIYDVDIDVVNKPFLPVAAGELSPALAWGLCLGLAAVGVTIVARNFGPLISALYSLGLLLGTLYSVPPFRLKRSAVAAFLIIATVRGFLLNFGVYYSTRAALGAGFVWSPAITFITTFVTLFAVVIAVTKDLPDVEGDRQNGIETFATRLGVRNTALAAIGILLANYGAAMFMALKPVLGFKPQVMFTGHALLAAFLLYRARQLEVAGYTRNAILAFYQQIWTLFYLEYSMFPFI